MKITRKLTAICLALVLAVATGLHVSATPTTARLINVHSVQGDDVTLARTPGGRVRSITPRSGQSIHRGYVLNTGRNSFLYMQLDGTSIAKMDEVSRVAVSTVRNALSLSVQLGELLMQVEQQRPDHSLQVLIGNMAFSVRGTTFIIGHRQVGPANAAFVTMLSGEGAMQMPGMAREVPVLAGQTLLAVPEQQVVEQHYTIRAFDITDMSLFELREIYSRRDMLLDAGILTQQQIQQIPGQIRLREAERGIVPDPPTPPPAPPMDPPQPPTPLLASATMGIGGYVGILYVSAPGGFAPLFEAPLSRNPQIIGNIPNGTAIYNYGIFYEVVYYGTGEQAFWMHVAGVIIDGNRFDTFNGLMRADLIISPTLRAVGVTPYHPLPSVPPYREVVLP